MQRYKRAQARFTVAECAFSPPPYLFCLIINLMRIFRNSFD